MPKHVDFLTADFGIDGLYAFRQAARAARKLQADVGLVRVIPMSWVVTKDLSGLDLYKMRVWEFLFSTEMPDIGVWAMVDSAGASTHLMDTAADSSYKSYRE